MLHFKRNLLKRIARLILFYYLQNQNAFAVLISPVTYPVTKIHIKLIANSLAAIITED